MDGIRIFIHAVRMVVGNLPVAFRIGGVLLAVQVALGLLAGPAAIGSGSGMNHAVQMASPAMVLLGLARIVFGLWIAVAWHRFILLEEMPGAALPIWNGSAIWSYFKAGVISVLIVVAAVIPTTIVAGFLVYPFLSMNPQNPSLFAMLIGFLVIYVPAAFIGYRIAPMLPSAAVSTRMPLREAWAATASSGAAFAVLALVSILAAWALNLPGLYLARASFLLGLIWSTAAEWLTVVVGASILTTIYGHYVEKRDLNA